jgi:hypothetical protein
MNHPLNSQRYVNLVMSIQSTLGKLNRWLEKGETKGKVEIVYELKTREHATIIIRTPKNMYKATEYTVGSTKHTKLMLWDNGWQTLISGTGLGLEFHGFISEATADALVDASVDFIRKCDDSVE